MLWKRRQSVNFACFFAHMNLLALKPSVQKGEVKTSGEGHAVRTGQRQPKGVAAGAARARIQMRLELNWLRLLASNSLLDPLVLSGPAEV